MNYTTTIQTQSRPQPWLLPEPVQQWDSDSERLGELAQGFAPISLKEMDAVALLNRTDTKFMMSAEQLLTAMASLQQDYRILSVHGQRINHYRTLYFDTPGFDLYNLHVNERADRYKVRSREYTDSHLAFLEVKHKTSKGRTIKDRMKTGEPVLHMTLEAENWLHEVLPFDSSSLEPKLWNTFTRVTMVSKQYCERVTLDVDLAFYTEDKLVNLEGLAIAEVKMDSANHSSPFLMQMHDLKIHPQGCSKYCIGVSMLYDQVKKNALKSKLLWIERTVGGLS